MNSVIFDRRRAERFAQLLDEANGGRRHHSRSRVDDDLAQLVGVGQQLTSISLPGAPNVTFKRDLRAQLMATAEREGIGVTAQPDEPDQAAAWSGQVAGRARARGAVIIGIAVGTLALSGVSVASGEAVPGDALYGVKRSTERAQLALAGSEFSRGQLYLEFARTRLQEAHAVRGDARGLGDALRDMDDDTQLGVRLLTTAAWDKRDTASLDSIDRFVTDQRMLVGELLDLTGATAREQVTESLSLLDSIAKRSLAVRSAMACDAKATSTDTLGPLPGLCGVALLPTQQIGEPRRQTPMEEATGVPTATNPDEVAPTASAAPSAPAVIDIPAETQKESEGGLLGELGRILGGLLG